MKLDWFPNNTVENKQKNAKKNAYEFRMICQGRNHIIYENLLSELIINLTMNNYNIKNVNTCKICLSCRFVGIFEIPHI